MLSSLFRAALGAVAFAAACGAASAATVKLDGWSFGNGRFVGGSVDGRGFAATAGGVGGAVAGVGDASTGAFASYFVEFDEPYTFGVELDGYSLVAGADYFGSAAKADMLGRLMRYASRPGSSVDTAFESTALQVAIWNVVYDDDLLTGRGDFALDLTGQVALILEANSQLQAASALTSPYDVYVLTRAGARDLLLTVPEGTDVGLGTPVPEPGTAALGLLALGAMGAGLRRRRR